MRAAVMIEAGKPLVIDDVEPSAPGPTDVVVEVVASGVCHSDLSVRNGLFQGIVDKPMVLGHEFAGRVVEAGDQVGLTSVGDFVIGAFRPACGRCRYCLRGSTHLCTKANEFLQKVRGTLPDGSHYVSMSGLGTFAERVTCDESSVVPVTTDIPAEQLALLGCGFTTGVGAALFTADVAPGSSVAVVGCGGVGQATVQGARLAGAAIIIAIDPLASKRALALQSGATHAIDPLAEDARARVLELTEGYGVDVAFDVVGGPDVVAGTYRLVARGGTLVLVGYGPMDAQLQLPAFDLQTQEKTVKGCVAGSAQVRRDFPRFVKLIESGRLDTASMVSTTIRLEDVNDALDAMHASELVRSVITF